MSFLKKILEGGNDYVVDKNSSTVSFQPKNNLADFQSIAKSIIKNNGAGYIILLSHKSSTQGANWIDLITIELQ